MATQTPTSTTPKSPRRHQTIGGGLRSVAKATWFLLSIPLYILGTVLDTFGKFFVRISGWESAKTAAQRNDTPKRD